MQFFLDTGIVDEIKKAAAWGIVNGVTTNPSLIAKSGRSQRDVITEITQIVDGPISAEVIATDHEGMVKEATELAKIHDNVVIKLPMTQDGLIACKKISSQGVMVNMTLIFSSNQALMCAKNGATYVSPFIGRLDDIGHDGMALISEIRQVFTNFDYEPQVLAASIRHATHVRDCSFVGADVATMPYKVMETLFKHPLTDKGLAAFLADHAKTQS